MKNSLLIGLALFSLGCTAVVRADDDPDRNQQHMTTVAWIKEQDRNDNIDADDRYVVLIGTVTKKTDEETYLFSDGTGSIQLDSEKELPLGMPIVIRGRIDQAFMGIGRLEVDVKSWRHVKPSHQR